MKQADAKTSVPIAAQETKQTRRSYAPEFKRDVVAQCLVPGASVSAIALSHGINANVIRKWLPLHRAGTSTSSATMLPVTIKAAAPVATSQPRMYAPVAATRPPIELSLGAATVRFPAGFDPTELHSIVQILAALR